jgi:hypothetical protein
MHPAVRTGHRAATSVATHSAPHLAPHSALRDRGARPESQLASADLKVFWVAGRVADWVTDEGGATPRFALAPDPAPDGAGSAWGSLPLRTSNVHGPAAMSVITNSCQARADPFAHLANDRLVLKRARRGVATQPRTEPIRVPKLPRTMV